MIENFEYTHPNGWEDEVNFPETPTKEQVRPLLQEQHKEVRDYIKNTLVPGVNAHVDSTGNPHNTTAAQTGAVNKNGDTMAGALIFSNNYGVHLLKTDGTTKNGIKMANDNSTYVGDTGIPLWLQGAAIYLSINGVTRTLWNSGNFCGSSAWNEAHLTMGNYHFWVDVNGKLRMKSSAPASDQDGVVVGSQT